MIRAYSRVSTKKQDTKSQDDALANWLKDKDKSQYKRYKDKATGTNMVRPGFEKMMAEAFKDDTIVVWRLDRLGRTASGLTSLFEELQQKGINLISLCDGIDLKTASGRMIANVIASIAQYETEMRKERVHAGIAAAKANGKTWGGSKKGRRISVTKEKSDTIKRLYEEGMPIAEIARVVSVARPTVYKELKRED